MSGYCEDCGGMCAGDGCPAKAEGGEPQPLSEATHVCSVCRQPYNPRQFHDCTSALSTQLAEALSDVRRWKDSSDANRDEAMKQQDLKLGEKQRAEKLERQLAEARRERDSWKSVIIDAHIVNFSYQTEHETNPKKALSDLIGYEVMLALDPRVSKEAANLIATAESRASRAERALRRAAVEKHSKYTIMAKIWNDLSEEKREKLILEAQDGWLNSVPAEGE